MLDYSSKQLQLHYCNSTSNSGLFLGLRCILNATVGEEEAMFEDTQTQLRKYWTVPSISYIFSYVNASAYS